MAERASRKIFVNLAVRDLKKSMGFFSTLGFGFNPQFTDEKAAGMIPWITGSCTVGASTTSMDITGK